ncbi:MAG: 3'-5' exonuclease [Terrimicrobiaceae bacterium]|nr:3'-5' exonuclease [Terrimicrobiaceae bacterium]
MKIRDTVFAAIDFESAGSEPGRTDEPVQIAIVHLQNAETITPAFVSYLAPTRPVTWAARAVHGIGDDQLRAAPKLIDVWPQVQSALAGHWVVAHGAATERRFLRAFPLHAFGPWLDTLALARRVFPGLDSHALGDTIRHLHLEAEPEIARDGFHWHDAGCDAVASLVLLRHVIRSASLVDEDVSVLVR